MDLIMMLVAMAILVVAAVIGLRRDMAMVPVRARRFRREREAAKRRAQMNRMTVVFKDVGAALNEVGAQMVRATQPLTRFGESLRSPLKPSEKQKGEPE